MNQSFTSQQGIDSPSPEHNKLQNLFLDETNAQLLIDYLRTDRKINYKHNLWTKTIFEGENNWDIIISFFGTDEDILNDENEKKICFCHTNKIYCELKPLLGDDYPSVLRKMKTQKEVSFKRTNKQYFPEKLEFVLLIKEFSSHTTTKKELTEIFGAHEIRVVFMENLFSTFVTWTKEEKDEKEEKDKKDEKDEENKLREVTEQLNTTEQKIQKLETFLLKEGLQKTHKKRTANEIFGSSFVKLKKV
jgi:hypothetical protein